jgi:hypothetical protein
MQPPKNYKIRYDRVIAVAVIFVVLIILIATGINKFGKKNDDKSIIGKSNTSSHISDNNDSKSSDIKTITKKYADIHTGDLILINNARSRQQREVQPRDRPRPTPR